MISAERLKKFKIFKDAPAELLEKLGRDMTEKSFPAGTVICKEGETGGALYLIASGSVAIQKKAFQEESGSKTVARLEAGEFFGEMSFLQGLPLSATVAAQEDASVLYLSRASLEELLKKDPKAAADQVMTVSMGLSNRLRATTRELVTVYEIARAVGAAPTMDELARQVVGQLTLDLGASASVGFYRWNIFNDEYMLLNSEGPNKSAFPATLEPGASHLTQAGAETVASRIDMLDAREGLVLYSTKAPDTFDAGEKQMMETVSAVLAPALATARHREEEASRAMLQQSKQRYSA